MPLEILAPLVVFGVALAVVIVHFTGGSKGRTLASPEEAVDCFHTDYPDLDASKALLATDGKAALIRPKAPSPAFVAGLVMVMGNRFISRALARHDIAAVENAPDNCLKLRLSDFTIGTVQLHFKNARDAKTAIGWLDAESAK